MINAFILCDLSENRKNHAANREGNYKKRYCMIKVWYDYVWIIFLHLTKCILGPLCHPQDSDRGLSDHNK